MQTITGTDTSATIAGLKPTTNYDIRIRAQNKLGFSPYSDILRVTTSEEVPSGPPIDIRVNPLSAHSLRVTFNAPKPETRNGRILGYYLGYKLEVEGKEEHFVFKKVSISEAMDERMEVVLTHLKKDTKYAIIVQAFNSKGSGPQSAEVFGQTLANDPPKAPTISATNVDYESIEINWAFDDSEDSDNEDGYEVTGLYVYFKEQTDEWMERQIGSQTNFYRFDGLKCGTQYQVSLLNQLCMMIVILSMLLFFKFYVIAYNSVGKGDPSQAIAVKTKGSGPTAPKSAEQFLKVNTTWALISLQSWVPNGCPIKAFHIRYSHKHSNEWIEVATDHWPEDSSVELMPLSAGKWYSLEVRAVSDASTTQNVYSFATLTPSGGTVSPLEEDSPSANPYQSLAVIVPTTCSVIVLTVIVMVACFVVNKRSLLASAQQHNLRSAQSDHNCHTMDDSLVSQAFHLSVLDSQSKDSECSAVSDQMADKELYFQSPYALSRIQRQMCVRQESDLSLRPERAGDNQHIYQMPFPPKWV